MTVLCPFCSYLNRIPNSIKPNLINYLFRDDIRELLEGKSKILDKGGAIVKLNENKECILYPTLYSDLFDKVLQLKFEYYNYNVCDFTYWIDKKICEICLHKYYIRGDYNIIQQLDTKEKLFRLMMR